MAFTQPAITVCAQQLADASVRRIKSLMETDMTRDEIVIALNAEGYKTRTGMPWTNPNLRQVICRIRRGQKSWYSLAAKRAKFNAGEAH
jgi:hypothetical protein